MNEDKDKDPGGLSTDGSPLRELTQLVKQFQRWQDEARKQELARGERERGELHWAEGSTLSRVVRCADKLLECSEGSFLPLRRCALELAEEALWEHRDNEALTVALYLLGTVLEGNHWAFKKRREKFQEVREELASFLPGRGQPISTVPPGPARLVEALELPSADLALKSELEARVVDVLTTSDGVEYLSSTRIAQSIQQRHPQASSDDRAIRAAVARLRGRGWPIVTNQQGSRIPVSRRAELPAAFRSP